MQDTRSCLADASADTGLVPTGLWRRRRRPANEVAMTWDGGRDDCRASQYIASNRRVACVWGEYSCQFSRVGANGMSNNGAMANPSGLIPRSPVMLATWSFGARAIDAAWPQLGAPGGALDAVVTACREAERDPAVDSVGYGGLPDRDGHVTLDACVMLAPGKAGSVAVLSRHRHPAAVARLVMERTPHLMIAGSQADAFAGECGVPEEPLLSPEAKAAWERWRAEGAAAAVDQSADRGAGLRPVDGAGGGRLFQEERRWAHHDTIGVLAADATGEMAGACSTSGTPYKRPGRVGDSPIIGHGLWVDPEVGAATATGTGELISAVCGSFLVVERMRAGAAPRDAVEEALRRVERIGGLEPHHQVAFVAMARSGAWAAGALRPGFLVSVREGGGPGGAAGSGGARVEAPAVVLRGD